MRVELLFDPFEAGSALDRFTADAKDYGAVVSFTGVARAKGADGAPIDALVLEHHQRLTLDSMHVIARETLDRFAISDLCVLHRAGRIAPGAPIIFVAAAAAHRRPAFLAVDYAMDRLKSEAVFWKREEGPAGRSWVEPTEADAIDLIRWTQGA